MEYIRIKSESTLFKFSAKFIYTSSKGKEGTERFPSVFFLLDYVLENKDSTDQLFFLYLFTI